MIGVFSQVKIQNNYLFSFVQKKNVQNQNYIEALVRFGYALVVVTMLLMVWASLAGAREIENHKYPPCMFSPLCTCSKASPNDLGIIQCRNVPYPTVPRMVNNSKVIFFTKKMSSTYL